MTKSAAEIIKDKGVAAFAEATGRDPNVIRQWKHRNHLPRSAWPEIIANFPDLTLDALVAIEARS